MIQRRPRIVRRRVRYVRYRDDEWAVVVARAEAEGIAPSTFVREISVRVARADLDASKREGQ